MIFSTLADFSCFSVESMSSWIDLVEIKTYGSGAWGAKGA
jgi:hypothetical protein